MPAIVTSVPRGAFASVAGRLRREVNIPVVASNRINMPFEANHIIERGDADLVSMARPFLADPELVNKAASGRTDEINTCIGCNQACLGHTFANRRASCLVNPRACHETTLVYARQSAARKVAVVGAGASGDAAAPDLPVAAQGVESGSGAGCTAPRWPGTASACWPASATTRSTVKDCTLPSVAGSGYWRSITW
ncbi:oxidoreductase [Janthinobacterium agaricidamnosum]|uniref:oxidoreductase n=1 Tax=Janthinobacterium agaricidamnosum TaxID=55508 RepID=UPI003F76292A